jgi:hypothetical protein
MAYFIRLFEQPLCGRSGRSSTVHEGPLRSRAADPWGRRIRSSTRGCNDHSVDERDLIGSTLTKSNLAGEELFRSMELGLEQRYLDEHQLKDNLPAEGTCCWLQHDMAWNKWRFEADRSHQPLWITGPLGECIVHGVCSS